MKKNIYKINDIQTSIKKMRFQYLGFYTRGSKILLFGSI